MVFFFSHYSVALYSISFRLYTKINLVYRSWNECCRTSWDFDWLSWILIFRWDQKVRSFQTELVVQEQNSGNSDTAVLWGAEHTQLVIVPLELKEHILWDAAWDAAVPNTAVPWSPCLLTEFWNCPLRLILCKALPWGALIKLPISPTEHCNFPCDVNRKLRTAVAKETAEAKWNGLLAMSLGDT